jgi:hypothetical protein
MGESMHGICLEIAFPFITPDETFATRKAGLHYALSKSHFAAPRGGLYYLALS